MRRLLGLDAQGDRARARLKTRQPQRRAQAAVRAVAEIQRDFGEMIPISRYALLASLPLFSRRAAARAAP